MEIRGRSHRNTRKVTLFIRGRSERKPLFSTAIHANGALEDVRGRSHRLKNGCFSPSTRRVRRENTRKVTLDRLAWGLSTPFALKIHTRKVTSERKNFFVLRCTWKVTFGRSQPPIWPEFGSERLSRNSLFLRQNKLKKLYAEGHISGESSVPGRSSRRTRFLVGSSGSS